MAGNGTGGNARGSWRALQVARQPLRNALPDAITQSSENGETLVMDLQVCDCSTDVARSRFKILFSARFNSILRILEALSIKRFAPDLCVQKEHVLSLILPW